MKKIVLALAAAAVSIAFMGATPGPNYYKFNVAPYYWCKHQGVKEGYSRCVRIKTKGKVIFKHFSVYCTENTMTLRYNAKGKCK